MTLCNLNIEMGGRSGFVAPDEATFKAIVDQASAALKNKPGVHLSASPSPVPAVAA